MDGPDRRPAKSILDYWQLGVVIVGLVVSAITFYNKVQTLVDDEKNFKSTVDARRDQSHKDMEDIRTRLTKIEQWKEDKGR